MKTESKEALQEKEFDTVKTFRAIKDKISLEMADMNFEQIKEYLKTNSAKLYANSTAHNSSIGSMAQD
jgi:phosphoribosylformylglycinamidine (FGAM) synthase PurS component